MDSDDDVNLVARVLAGDRSAFGVLIDRHRAGALAFARRLVSRADAEDVVQDTLIAPEAFEQAGPYVLTVDQEFAELEAIHQKLIAEGRAEPDAAEMEWRSVRSLPRAETTWVKIQA